MKVRYGQLVGSALAVLTMMFVAGCANPATQTRSLATATGSSSVSSASSSVAVRPGGILRASVGADHGQWALSKSHIAIFDGQRWTSVPYPNGITPSEVSDIRTAAPSDIWLAGVGSAGPEVYRHSMAGGGWTATALNPAWPSGVNLGGITPQLTFADGPPGILVVLATASLGHVVNIPRWFVSRDGGATFTQVTYPANWVLNTVWSDPTMENKSLGVMVSGPAHDHLNVTNDAGTTWQSAAVTGLVDASRLFFGAPFDLNGDLTVPVFYDHSGTQQLAFAIYAGGETFSAGKLPILQLNSAYQAGTVPLTAAGSALTVLSADAQTVYRYEVGQSSWKSSPTSGLPANVTSLSALGGSRIDAAVSDSVCRDGKTDCTTTVAIFTSPDGGVSWSQTSVD